MRHRGKGNRNLVMGIDPGSRSLGYGVVEVNGAEFRYVSSGRIVPEAGNPLHSRLVEIYEGVAGVIDEFGPSEVVVEKVFFAKSAKSALSLGHARGVALLAAASAGIEIHEYSALAVKKAVTGYGKAEKGQVQEMVRNILEIRGALSSDGADALALALCHINCRALNRAIGTR